VIIRQVGVIAGYCILAPLFLVAAAMGVVMLSLYPWTVGEWAAMRMWREVPAHVHRVDLVSKRVKKGRRPEVRAEYSYEWKGQTHRSDQVFPDVQCGYREKLIRSVHDAIAARRGDRGPFRCYVNPKDPAQAVLYRYSSGVFIVMIHWFLVGGLLMFLAAAGWRRWRDRQCRMRHPEEPWLGCADWESGVIPEAREITTPSAVLQAVFFNLLCLTVVPIALLDARDGNRSALLLLELPAIGSVVAFWAARRLLRWRRGLETAFELEVQPGGAGGWLTGRARVRAKRPPANGAAAVLECSRWKFVEPRKNNVKQRETLWRESFSVPQDTISREGPMTVVPVRLRIPSDLPPSGKDEAGWQTEWELRVVLGVSVHDRFAEFVLPVFPGRGDDPAAEAGEKTAECLPMDPHETLRAAQIQEETLPDGGVALTFPKVPTHPGVLVGSVLVLYAQVMMLLVIEKMISWNPALLLGGAAALAALSAPVLPLLSRCARPRRLVVQGEDVSMPGGLLWLGFPQYMRLDTITGVEVATAFDLIGRTSEVRLVAGDAWMVAAHRLSNPVALAVQRVLEPAIKDYVGKTT